MIVKLLDFSVCADFQCIKTGNVNHELFCRFLFSQLYHDGHPNLAASLAKLTNTQPNCPPSDHLLHIVSLGLKTEQGTLHFNSSCLQ